MLVYQRVIPNGLHISQIAKQLLIHSTMLLRESPHFFQMSHHHPPFTDHLTQQPVTPI